MFDQKIICESAIYLKMLRYNISYITLFSALIFNALLLSRNTTEVLENSKEKLCDALKMYAKTMSTSMNIYIDKV